MEQVKILGIAPENSLDSLRGILDSREINCVSAIPADENLLPNVISLPFDGAVMYSERLDVLDRRFLEQLYMTRKDIAVILLCDEIHTAVYDGAMHCGVTRLIRADADPDEICAAIIEETQRSLSRKQTALVRNFDSRVIAFFSSKGGSGKTTSAVNTAAVLAGKGKKVALIDADMQFGDVAGFLNVSAAETLAELAAETNITPATVKGYLTPSNYGISCIISPTQPEQALAFPAGTMETVISMLRADFDCVVVDLPAAINTETLAIMKMCDTVYFVLNPEVASMRNAKICLGCLARYGLTSKVKMVLAKTGHSYVRERDIEPAIGMKPCAGIPFDIDPILSASNNGVPLVVNAPDSKAARAYVAFTEREFNLEPEAKKHSSGLLWRNR